MSVRIAMTLAVLWTLGSTAAATTDLQWQQTNGPYEGTGRVFIHPMKPELVFGAGHNFFRSEDRGSTWEVLLLDVDPDINTRPDVTSMSFCRTRPERMYATCAKRLLHSPDWGKTWSTLLEADDRFMLVEADPFDAERVFLVYKTLRKVVTGPLLVSTDAGKSFRETSLLECVIPKSLHCDVNHRGCVLMHGDDGGDEFIYISRDHGEAWTEVPLPEPETKQTVVGYSLDPEDGDLLYLAMKPGGGPRITYWFTFDLGKTWEVFWSEAGGMEDTDDIRDALATQFPRAMAQKDIDRPMIGFLASEPGIIYSQRKGGAVFRSRDGGVSWQKISEGFSFARADKVIPHPVKPGVAFCRTHSDSWFMTEDYGAHWRDITCQRASGFKVFALHPLAPDTLFTGGSNGLWRSEDKGETWEKVGVASFRHGVKAVLFDEKDPRTFHVLFYRKILTTTDGGTSWEERTIPPVDPVYAVSTCLAGKPGAAVAPHGKLVVVTPDGIATERTPDNKSESTRFCLVCPDDGSTVAIGVENGLLVSRDHGKTWTRVCEESPEYDSVCLAARRHNAVILLKKDGEIAALDLDTAGETVLVRGDQDYPPAYFCRSIAVSPVDGTLWVTRQHLGVWIVRSALDSLNREEK